MDVVCARCRKVVDSAVARDTSHGWICAGCVQPADLAPTTRSGRGAVSGVVGIASLGAAAWFYHLARTHPGDSDMAGVMSVLLLFGASLVSGLVGLIATIVALARFSSPGK